ncbi:hypothetical protein B0T20DRAFT_98496 [Sordaria brevicollis]|uniref:Uncharacterized protein n=1 Tax=Sordaria brevicollis TaxID=83679 RepID=A0AAE0NVQ4_SORBR|nr:hypothetical protein B0T20DRAFT_98496 [Sordaria brevicollis]
MLSLKLTTLALLATLSVAAPTPASTTVTSSISTTSSSEEIKPFSFSQWVDDILNPNVVALTPEQALEAYYESINNSTTTSSGPELSKRAGAACETDNSKRMPVADAVWLVNTMAAAGQKLVYIHAPFISKVAEETANGRSRIIGQKTLPTELFEPSEYWARAGGFIMDACTWGSMSGGKILMPANQFITVLLQGEGY